MPLDFGNEAFERWDLAHATRERRLQQFESLVMHSCVFLKQDLEPMHIHRDYLHPDGRKYGLMYSRVDQELMAAYRVTPDRRIIWFTSAFEWANEREYG